MDLLGDTLDAIAREKAGIIKTGVPVVLGSTHPVLAAYARSLNAPVYMVTKRDFPTNMLGSYQSQNLSTACTIADYLHIPQSIQRQALMHIEHLGRMQYIEPHILLEGAHNTDGFMCLSEYLQGLSSRFPAQEYYIMLKRGKHIGQVEKYFPHVSHWHAPQTDHPLLLTPEDIALQTNRPIISCTIPEALERARSATSVLHVFFGSLYGIGSVYSVYKKSSGDS